MRCLLLKEFQNSTYTSNFYLYFYIFYFIGLSGVGNGGGLGTEGGWPILAIPAVSDGLGAISMQCLVKADRKNGDSELWVAMEPETLDYISKLAPVDVEVPCKDNGHREEREPDHHANRNPLLTCGMLTPKRQTSLDSFFSSNSPLSV